VWYSGLLWLVVLAVVSRYDLMCRLIRLHTRGCVGSQILLAACLSIGKHLAQLIVLVWGEGGWMARSKSEWVWAARGLFGDEIAVLVEGKYVELFIC